MRELVWLTGLEAALLTPVRRRGGRLPVRGGTCWTTEPMAATWKLEFPYRRSVGPLIGEFLAGLRDRRVLGVRTADGRVLVPPLEYDPETGDATGDTVEVGQSGVVQHSAWIAEPLRNHPLDRPFAWALVTLDGADTAMLHALDSGSADAAAPGTRVRIRWADDTEGKITDIACFELQS